MAITFFDLDKTLLARNSGTMWVRRELGAGHVSVRQVLRAWSWIGRYHLGFARLEKALLEAIATMCGGLEAETRERTERFYAREVRRLFRPGARAAVESHRAAGDRLVLLTSSSSYIAAAAAADLGLDDWIANRFEVGEDGRYTGRALEPLCYGAGKVIHASRYLEASGIALSACVFYSDSASDLPMLEAVGLPVAVNPDPRLRLIARMRGWKVVDWGEPA